MRPEGLRTAKYCTIVLTAEGTTVGSNPSQYSINGIIVTTINHRSPTRENSKKLSLVLFSEYNRLINLQNPKHMLVHYMHLVVIH